MIIQKYYTHELYQRSVSREVYFRICLDTVHDVNSWQVFMSRVTYGTRHEGHRCCDSGLVDSALRHSSQRAKHRHGQRMTSRLAPQQIMQTPSHSPSLGSAASTTLAET